MINEGLKTAVSELLAGHAGTPVTIRSISQVGGGCINDSFRLDTPVGVFFMKYNDASRYPGMFEAEARGLGLLGGNEGEREGGREGERGRDWRDEGTKGRREGEREGEREGLEGRRDEGREGGREGERGCRDDACFVSLANADGDTTKRRGGERERGRGGEGPRVPGVVGVGGDERYSFLVLEYLESGGMSKGFWEDFGLRLANLHRHSSGVFGLDHANYIGSLPQSNKTHKNWIDFFAEERLEAQLRLARDAGRVERELGNWFQALYRHLPDLFPEEPPALLHGDLWSGNYMVGPDGRAAIVDPAVYYGHRYMDLGMSKLFGGFAPAFYRAYDDAYPLEKGWQESIEIANLYPLMVHVNLFGGGYLGSVKQILRRYRK